MAESPDNLNTPRGLSDSKSDQKQEPPATIYQYRNLQPDEIRVIDLLPGTDPDEITVQVRHTPMQDPLDSECTALSYTWGNPEINQTIYCSEGQGQLIVTTECASALRRIRLPDKSKTLWVDAICINQSDILERNHQITLMSKIYHFSSKVAIYLGFESEDSPLALKYLTDHYYDRFPMGLANMSLLQMEATQKLFSRPWFSRVWVIQEARNARKAEVICGSEVISWECILTLPWNAPYLPESSLGQQPYVALPPATYWRKEDYPFIGDVLSPGILFQHLMRARSCHATDARDKLFALLPLFKDSDATLARADLSPDYTYSTEKVFLNVARYLAEGIGWALLYAAECGSNLDLPSWCPDWSVLPANRFLYSFERLPSKDQFSLPNDDKTQSPTLLTKNILQIHGVRYAKITKTSEPCNISDPNWVEIVFQDWYDFALSALVPNTVERVQLSEQAIVSLCSVAQFLSASRYGGSEGRHEEVRIKTMNAYRDGENQGYKQTQNKYQQRCQGQRIFATGNEEEVGLAPVSTEVGDVVICVKGGTVPFLVREKGDGMVVLVGKCEINEFESREFVEGVLKDGGVLEKFLIV